MYFALSFTLQLLFSYSLKHCHFVDYAKCGRVIMKWGHDKTFWSSGGQEPNFGQRLLRLSLMFSPSRLSLLLLVLYLAI